MVALDKKNILILGLLLFLLILPRLIIYPLFGPGIVGTDAEDRYFLQAEKLSESFSSFFSQTGPAYSLFLLFFKKINNDMVTGPVFFQHIFGIISGVLIFYYFKRINLPLAFIVTILSYSSWIALWLEHTILREALVSFFVVLLAILLSLTAKDKKYFKFLFGFLAGVTGLTLIFLRIEFIALFLATPLILLIIRKKNSPELRFWNRMSLKWILGYVFPLVIVYAAYVAASRPLRTEIPYGSLFNISYHSLNSEVFYYKNSQHPALLKGYQEVLEANNGRVSKSMAKFYETTEEYLVEHPELKFSTLQIMDRLYLEMITKNTLAYLKSSLLNLKNHLIGIVELNTLASRDKISGIRVVDELIQVSNSGLRLFHLILFWLFLPSLPFLFIKWRTLPSEVIIAFFIGAIHLFVLTVFSNPAHRFRYPIDPFLYFLQLYLILYFLKTLSSKTVRLFVHK